MDSLIQKYYEYFEEEGGGAYYEENPELIDILKKMTNKKDYKSILESFVEEGLEYKDPANQIQMITSMIYSFYDFLEIVEENITKDKISFNGKEYYIHTLLLNICNGERNDVLSHLTRFNDDKNYDLLWNNLILSVDMNNNIFKNLPPIPIIKNSNFYYITKDNHKPDDYVNLPSETSAKESQKMRISPEKPPISNSQKMIISPEKIQSPKKNPPPSNYNLSQSKLKSFYKDHPELLNTSYTNAVKRKAHNLNKVFNAEPSEANNLNKVFSAEPSAKSQRLNKGGKKGNKTLKKRSKK